MSLSLPGEGCSGFGAQREHSFFECSCRSSQWGWDPSGMPSGLLLQLPFTPTASSGLPGQKQEGWTWPLGASHHTNTQSKLWHCKLSSLGRQKARAFTRAASAAHLFLTRPSLWPALSKPTGLAAAVTLQPFQPYLVRLIFISHRAVAE